LRDDGEKSSSNTSSNNQVLATGCIKLPSKKIPFEVFMKCLLMKYGCIKQAVSILGSAFQLVSGYLNLFNHLIYTWGASHIKKLGIFMWASELLTSWDARPNFPRFCLSGEGFNLGQTWPSNIK
jgi:hypothetical protein